MSSSKVVPILAVIITALIFFYTFSGKDTATEKPPSLAYASRLKNEREQKDKFLRESEHSPIKVKGDFKALQYFNISENYKVMASLKRSTLPQQFILPNSAKSTDTLMLYGTATFEIDRKTQQLLVFRSVINKLLFVPFKDATSGHETYGGGRYLDIPLTNVLGNKIELDFNQAYHPYCAYAADYSCPIPPKENTISVAVKAGEKL
jgi:uncharacterized protein